MNKRTPLSSLLVPIVWSRKFLSDLGTRGRRLRFVGLWLGLLSMGLPGASAEAADWNRRVDAAGLKITNTGVSTWEVTGVLQVARVGAAGSAADLSTRIRLLVNGTPQDSLELQVPPKDYPGDCCTVGCGDAQHRCQPMFPLLGGVECKCVLLPSYSFGGVTADVDDIFTISIVPADGASPEVLNSDDQVSRSVSSVPVGSPVTMLLMVGGLAILALLATRRSRRIEA